MTARGWCRRTRSSDDRASRGINNEGPGRSWRTSVPAFLFEATNPLDGSDGSCDRWDMTKTTLTNIIRSNGITLTAEQTTRNPYMLESMPNATHWKCTLRMGDRSFFTYFSLGAAYTSAPSIENLIECLVMDADILVSSSFEEW